MSRLTIVTALGVTMLAAPSAWGAGMTGNQLALWCEAPEHSSDGLACYFYIDGVLDGIFACGVASHPFEEGVVVVGPWRICWPKEATDVQLHAVVKKWLKAHPEEWHEPAPILIRRALSEAFPCKESQ